MVVECYFDKIEQKKWHQRENDDLLFNQAIVQWRHRGNKVPHQEELHDVCEEVALAPTVPAVHRVNRWNRYKEVEC